MTRRTERLGEEIREEVAQMITAELKDPRIGFVTVTRVDLGPDLRQARVYVGVLGTEKQREKSLSGLKQASGFMRRALGQRLRLRHTPELVFQYDEGLEASDRVARLLDEIQKPEADPASSDDDDGEE
jgi:ribosome-binding factor A